MSRSSRARHLRSFRVGAIVVGFALLAWGIHCGSDAESTFTPCEGVLKGQCGSPCVIDTACPAGQYCAGGKCTADCVAGGAACANHLVCSPHGRCGIDPAAPDEDAQGPVFAEDGGDATGGDACADIDVTLAKVTPTVVVLIDRSSSMNTAFPPGVGNPSRWDVLRDALISPDGGIIKTLENDVSFGVTTYTSTGTPGCPLLGVVGYKIGNYQTIASFLNDAGPIQNTPTGDSVLAVAGIEADGGAILDGGFVAAKVSGPKFIVLATDGDPDMCSAPSSNGTDPPRELVVRAVSSTFDAGVRTYVIAMGTDINLAHEQAVANVGLGYDPDAGDAAPLFRTNNKQQLVDAFDQIIYGVRSCTFQLNGSVVAGTEKSGTVTLNGAPLTYQDPNGWTLSSPTKLELLGAACAQLKSTNAALSVKFPCGSIVK